MSRLDADVGAVVSAGLARAKARPNNMARVAAALAPPKEALFHVTYAVMRMIDDFVDEDFMARPAAERAATRADALAVVDRWQAQAEAAAAGRFRTGAEALEPGLFTVMNKVVGNSMIGGGPWCALAAAMRADIAEGDLVEWSDFAGYAEGAAVAPASIFIYILAAEVDNDISSRISLAGSPADYARDLAIFCYLVHILRDLSSDAGRADRLLTIPGRTLAECNLDKPALARAAAGDPSVDLVPLVGAIVAHAAPFRQRSVDALAALRPQIGTRERLVIDTLFALYDSQYDAIASRPGGVADGSIALGTAAIGAILKRLVGAV